jgi:hypothetical protein
MSNTAPEVQQNLSKHFEADSADRRIARRNMQIGLWAGTQLKLSQEGCAIYALEVMVAGMIDSGHDEVVEKIMGDFAKQGVSISRGQILVQLSKNCRSAARSNR